MRIRVIPVRDRCRRAAAKYLVLLALVTATSAALAGDWHYLPMPDQSDWSAKRIANFSVNRKPGAPLAVIRVPSKRIEAAVYPDTFPGSLEAGVAWVTSTPKPGSPGNVVIAGHRDSFFRKLEGISKGARIDLQTESAVLVFEVESIEIVDPLDTSPLAQTPEDVLTLITCHPFYYNGYAPDRYIVRATRVRTSTAAAE
jgi:sortase A